jgi:putative hydrolases of HD superfamily
MEVGRWNLVQLWRLVARLKAEPRRGWVRVSGVENVESVADHSFGLAILSLFEAERRGYNVERALKLALIHDLEEAFTGDLTPGDKRRLTAKGVGRLRESARREILRLIPSERRVEYRALWRDLADGRTREARLVKDLDKLEMAFQARNYETLGVEHRQLVRFYNSAFSRMEDEELRKMARRFAKRGLDG